MFTCVLFLSRFVKSVCPYAALNKQPYEVSLYRSPDVYKINCSNVQNKHRFQCLHCEGFTAIANVVGGNGE